MPSVSIPVCISILQLKASTPPGFVPQFLHLLYSSVYFWNLSVGPCFCVHFDAVCVSISLHLCVYAHGFFPPLLILSRLSPSPLLFPPPSQSHLCLVLLLFISVNAFVLSCFFHSSIFVSSSTIVSVSVNFLPSISISICVDPFIYLFVLFRVSIFVCKSRVLSLDVSGSK